MEIGTLAYQPWKNLDVRLPFWCFALSGLVLADELVKEGYLFKPEDVLVPFSHEQLFLLLVGAGTVLTVFKASAEETERAVESVLRAIGVPG